MRRARQHKARHHAHRPFGAAGGGAAGFTLTELYVVCVVLVILAGISFPIAKNVHRRQKETELRQALRVMRNAIDEYFDYCKRDFIIDKEVGSQCYPPELETLIEPVDVSGGRPVEVMRRFLRAIPVDPMTGEREWGLRSSSDDWDSDFWGGEDVFDVYSLSEGRGLNGVPYKEW